MPDPRFTKLLNMKQSEASKWQAWSKDIFTSFSLDVRNPTRFFFFSTNKKKSQLCSSLPEERGMFQATLHINLGLETTLQWTTSACLYHCAQLNGSRPVHFSIIIDPLMLIAEAVTSFSNDKFLQRKSFYPVAEKFEMLIFNLSVFLVWSCFDWWRT